MSTIYTNHKLRKVFTSLYLEVQFTCWLEGVFSWSTYVIQQHKVMLILC